MRHTLDIRSIESLWYIHIYRDLIVEADFRRNIKQRRASDSHERWVEVFHTEFAVEFLIGSDTTVWIGASNENVTEDDGLSVKAKEEE